MKKVLSLFMALAMVLCIFYAVPACAADKTINSLADIKEPIVVQAGDRVFDVENGKKKELIGPESDVGTKNTPLLALRLGSVVLKLNEIHVTDGSAVTVSRSSTRPSNEKWTMEHEAEIKYEQGVKVDVPISGPDLSVNPMQYCRVRFKNGSRNRKMDVTPLGTFYWILNRKTNQPQWQRFDMISVLDSSAEKPDNDMYQWNLVYKQNATQTEPDYKASEGKVYKNQVYDTTRQSMNEYNLYIPKSVKKGKPASLILCIHGGSWQSGSKEDMDYMCARFARHGYIAATIDYRLYHFNNDITDHPATCMDDITTDITHCINKIVKQTKDLGYDLVNMATTGYSAGGHLALLYAYAFPNASKLPVKAVFSQVGPADFHPDSWKPGMFRRQTLFNIYADVLIPNYDNLSAEEKEAQQNHISPLYYVNKNSVPSVMTYGKEDHLVGYGHGEKLDKKLTECGVKHKTIYLEKSDHPSEFDHAALEEFWKTTYEYGNEYLNPQI